MIALILPLPLKSNHSNNFEELFYHNDDPYEGFNEVGNQDPVALSLAARSQKRLVAELKWIVVTYLCGGFLGTEFPGHNKLTFTGICGHMLWSCVAGVLAAAKESQGGWHCPGPIILKSS